MDQHQPAANHVNTGLVEAMGLLCLMTALRPLRLCACVELFFTPSHELGIREKLTATQCKAFVVAFARLVV